MSNLGGGITQNDNGETLESFPETPMSPLLLQSIAEPKIEPMTPQPLPSCKQVHA